MLQKLFQTWISEKISKKKKNNKLEKDKADFLWRPKLEKQNVCKFLLLFQSLLFLFQLM